jgi:hypothetical protein
MVCDDKCYFTPLKKCRSRFKRDLQSLPGLCDHSSECLWLAYGNVCQHLAVELDVRLFEPGDQLAVGGSVQAGRGVDAGDPQLAKIALAHAAITGRVPEALEHGLIRTLEQPVLGAALSLGDL